ncbi:MAG: hypothetical protein ABSH53_23345 [Holophaga sp.]
MLPPSGKPPKPDPIYIQPGTFSIAGTNVHAYIEDLERRIARLQVLLGEDLNAALAGMSEATQADTSALICFTGAFTGMSTLLNLCFYTRGIIALEDGMETQRDRILVEGVRKILVPLVLGQADLLKASLEAHRTVPDAALRHWYSMAMAELESVRTLVSRLA